MSASPDTEGVGLGDLIHDLVGETFEAIHASRLSQARQRQEVLALARLSSDDYAAREVSEEAVDALLARLFPTDGTRDAHDIAVGRAYHPACDEVPEEPPIAELTGLRLQEGDYAAVASAPVRNALMAPGVEAVRAWARRSLAEQELAPLRELARAGIPTVAVHKGRLRVKTAYSLADAESADAAAPGSRREALRGRPLDAVAARSAARPRLLVRPADERRADVQNLLVDVFGDVELEFILKD